MHNFRKLTIWVSGMSLVKKIYLIVDNLPEIEKYGLISQIKRSAVSIPSNIAEGSARTSDKEFAHFLRIALGSSFELETQLILSTDLRYLSEDDTNQIVTELVLLQKSITNFIKTLN